MQSEGDFRLGFWFALLLARTMGFDVKPSAICDQLRSVARGEVTLMPSPDDALHDVQANLGRPLTETEIELFQSCLSTNHAERDARSRDLANLILAGRGNAGSSGG